MNSRVLIAALAVLVLPIAGFAEQSGSRISSSGPKPSTADVDRVVGNIASNKDKTRAYCDIVSLNGQIAQADQQKDTKKVEELLAKKADETTQKLGDEYTTLMSGLQQIEPSSKEGEQLAAAFDALDQLCK